MAIKTPALKLETPTEEIPFGRGFYQMEEELLYLPVEYRWPAKRFYSYLDSDSVSLHLDRDGRLLFIEVDIPRRKWQVTNNFSMPTMAWPGKVKFLDFRQTLANPAVFCDADRSNILILFGDCPIGQNLFLAENLIGSVTADKFLTAIWAGNIVDDMAGQEIAAWRRSIRKKESLLPHSA